jgi:hypothetical protein
MRRHRDHLIQTRQWRPIPRLFTAVLLGALAVTGAGARAGDNSISGFDRITLAPGDTGTCESSPCTVYLKMPEGEGSYEVMSSGDGRIGEYPAGETVKLGSFWATQAFRIKGMDVPKAYAYIPNQP